MPVYKVIVTDEDGTVLDSLEQTYEAPLEDRPAPVAARKVIRDVADDIRFGVQ